MKFRVALAQVTTSEKKEENLERGISIIDDAAGAGARLLILPELFMAYTTLEQSPSSLRSIAEDVGGPFVSALAAEARKKRMYVALGILERSATRKKVHNTVVMLGPDGKVLAAHRKIQQFDSFGYKESSRFAPGTEIEGVFRTSLCTMGMMTCYELRFPEMARILAINGAELIVVPTAWVAGRMKEEHLHVLARARALENTLFVALTSQTGRIFTGRSIVVDPFGVPLCDAGEGEGLVTAEIDTGRIRQVREILPSLEQVKMDLYRRYL